MPGWAEYVIDSFPLNQAGTGLQRTKKAFRGSCSCIVQHLFKRIFRAAMLWWMLNLRFSESHKYTEKKKRNPLIPNLKRILMSRISITKTEPNFIIFNAPHVS